MVIAPPTRFPCFISEDFCYLVSPDQERRLEGEKRLQDIEVRVAQKQKTWWTSGFPIPDEWLRYSYNIVIIGFDGIPRCHRSWHLVLRSRVWPLKNMIFFAGNPQGQCHDSQRTKPMTMPQRTSNQLTRCNDDIFKGCQTLWALLPNVST